jgi:hypothetical protein
MPFTFNIEAAFTQLMSTMGSLQWEVSLIGERVEQSQIDIRESVLRVFVALFICSYFVVVVSKQFIFMRLCVFLYQWFFSNTLFSLCPFVTKRGSIFYFWTGNVFPNRSTDFCPKMAKGGVC